MVGAIVGTAAAAGFAGIKALPAFIAPLGLGIETAAVLGTLYTISIVGFREILTNKMLQQETTDGDIYNSLLMRIFKIAFLGL